MGKNLRKSLNKSIKISIPFSFRDRRRLAYRKLPGQLLKLSVLKLDGSSFCFQVEKDATVARLKLAIEEEFNLSHKDEGKILWPLVWSHFCLCYEGKNLINEKARIRSYGIIDGDQLHFIQHLGIDHFKSQHRSRNQFVESKQCTFLKAFGKKKRMISTQTIPSFCAEKN